MCAPHVMLDTGVHFLNKEINIGFTFPGKLGLSFHTEINENHGFQISKTVDFRFQKPQFSLENCGFYFGCMRFRPSIK